METLNEQGGSPVHDDLVDNTKAVIVTTAICGVALLGAHFLLGLNYRQGTNTDPDDDLRLVWQPIVGAALGIVAVVSFGGFYVAARRARVGIGASFILTFLSMLTFVLTIPALGNLSQTEADLARSLTQQFSGVVGTVVAFYFGTEAIISGLKLWKITDAPANAEVIKRADRDLGTSLKPNSN